MKRILPFIIGLLLWSCAEKVVEPPEDLIPEEKMVEILHDLAILNATKTSFKYFIDRYSVKTMDFLFDKYEIDSTQFAQSDRYYASVPLRYQMIYEKVEERLEERRKILEEIKKKQNDSTRAIQQKRTDSIKNIRKETKPSS